MSDSPLSFLFNNRRFLQSSVQRDSSIDDFYSDRSRVIFSSSFRRLQQKAQVFSLEPNASIRTRMTHTLEVADIGRTLASKISSGLHKKKLLSTEELPIFVAIVENACLLHDIGNPPFGHFGESAIREWANSLDEIAKKQNFDIESELYVRLMSDFHEYDGNPQGIRIITRLHPERDQHSLNLTYSTILAAIKYARSSGEEKETGIYKKAGYFQSEKGFVEKICQELERDRRSRFPLTYIMEVADDIAYCLSDISDGIEKNIITYESFYEIFSSEWSKKNKETPVDIKKEVDSFGLGFSVPVSRAIVEASATNFIDNYKDFLEGKVEQLIPLESANKILAVIKEISRKKLYTSIEAESIELTGYAVISGILEVYCRLLVLSADEFQSLSKSETKEFEYERRLYNRIGKRYIKAYDYMLEELPDCTRVQKLVEWWARIHLIIDHVSGMTDEFALDTYQMIKGIKLLPV